MDKISYLIILGVIALIILLRFSMPDKTTEPFYGGFYYPYDYPYYYPYFYSGCNENVFGDINCMPPPYLF